MIGLIVASQQFLPLKFSNQQNVTKSQRIMDSFLLFHSLPENLK